MTDQRPIDPSTLRDGDVVRAKRGEHGVVEGVLRWAGDEWQIRSGASIRTVIAHSGDALDSGWTITDILRPVLVKGDRVEVAGITGEVFAEPGGFLMVLWPDESTSAVPDVISRATRLPAAPEPAPIEVGDWWADEHGWPCVIVKVGDPLTWVRSWDSVRTHQISLKGIGDYMTRLDGPPEPPVGSVGIAGPVVFEATKDGIEITGSAFVEPWSAFCKRYSKWLITLQIVHTLGVE